MVRIYAKFSKVQNFLYFLTKVTLKLTGERGILRNGLFDSAKRAVSGDKTGRFGR